MNSAEFVRRIQSLQNELPIDDYRLGDDNVWPLIRYSVGSLTVEGLPANPLSNGGNGVSRRLQGLTKRGKKLFYDLYLSIWGGLKDYRHNDNLRPAQNLFVSQTIRRTELNGIWYDIFFDSLLDQNPSIEDWLMLELVVSNTLRVPRYRKSVYFNKNALFGVAAKKSGDRIALPWLPDLTGKVADHFGIDSLNVEKSILSSLSTFVSLKDFWAKTLNTVQPKSVYMVNWYSLTHMALTSVARSRGIKTVDIQHGLQGDHHWMYGCWRLPSTGQYELLPECFQVWGESERKSILSWSRNRFHRAEIVGNRWLKNSDDFYEKHGFKNEFIDRLKQEDRVVLFTHQHSNEPYFSTEIIAELAKQSKNALVLVRIHPGRLHEKALVAKRLSDAGITNFDIENASGLPLPLLLGHIALHITYNSSTVIEAAQLGVKSLVFDALAAGYFEDQIKLGIAKIMP